MSCLNSQNSHSSKTQRTQASGILALAIVAFFSSVSFAAEPNSGWTVGLGEAMEESKRTNKPVMLVFTGSDWCIWCKRLEAEVFATNEFSAWSEKIVKVEVDFPQSTSLPPAIAQQNEYLKQQYAQYVTSYPTVLFVDGDGSLIGKTGYVQGGPNAWTQQAGQYLPMQTVESTSDESVAYGKLEVVSYQPKSLAFGNKNVCTDR